MLGLGGKGRIVLHHLNDSRSQRVLWMLEELGLDYEVVRYERDATTRLAPPELKAVHPLGKSPVIQDGNRTVAESAAILDYLVRRHGKGRLAPPQDTPAYDDYVHWMHYPEGSAMLPVMTHLYALRLGEAAEPIRPRIESEFANHLGYIDQALDGRAWLLGDSFTAADIQLSFVLEAARAYGKLAAYPNAAAYLDRLEARPAFKKALEKGGPYNLGPTGQPRSPAPATAPPPATPVRPADYKDEAFGLLETVVDEDSFLKFLWALEGDFRESARLESQSPSSPYGPTVLGWENTSVDMVLQAAAAWALASRSSKNDLVVHDNPWRRCADILYAGKIYE